MSERHIVALGGGGFSDEGPASPLDDFILSLSDRPAPRVCFLPTAGGDGESYVASFYRAFASRKCRPTDLSLFRRTTDDLARFLREQDVIYVGGGNTANMLAIWRVHGVDRILRECWESGTVLAGVSAGAICWFEASITDSFGPDLAGLRDGLGLLAGSACPHYDGEPKRRPVYQRLVREGFPGGYAIDDGAALHFSGAPLPDVLSSRPNARAYEVRREGDRLLERVLSPRLLPAANPRP